MSYEKSPIDIFFYELFGDYPSKAGQSYELIVTGVLKLLNKESTVLYDQQIRGIFSNQKYQIDGVLGSEKIIEAKDYTLRKSKVGRPDVQKLEGGLVDLPCTDGIFASATGYTRNARSYAKGTISNPITKKIDLYEIRPSTLVDETGRIKTIILKLIITLLDFEKANWSPEISEENIKMLPILLKGTHEIKIESIYNPDGTIHITIPQWTETLNSQVNLEDDEKEITGFEKFNGKCLNIAGKLIPIIGMKYTIPIIKTERTIEIEQSGNACLYIKNEEGEIDTLLTDLDMKALVFSNGNVEIKSTKI
jgi:hypothetical protein